MKVFSFIAFLPLLTAARLEVSTGWDSDGGRQLQGRTQFAFGNQEAQNLGWPIGSYTCVQREICTLNDDGDDDAGGAISQAEESGVLGCKCCKKECSVANTDLSAINNCKDQCKARFGKEVCQLTGTIPSSSCIGINSPTTANTNTNSQVSPNRVGDCSLPIPDGPFSLTDCGVWQSIQAPDGKEQTKFGAIVAIDGMWMAIGANGDSNGRGAVYMFEKAVSGYWSYRQKLEPLNGQDGDEFVYADISRDFLAVGAKLTDFYGKDSGAAYVFHLDSAKNEWQLESKIIPRDGASNDYFGNNLSIRQSRLLIGARLDNNRGMKDVGAVYAYYRNSRGEWGDEQKIVVNNGEVGDQFGARINFDDEGNSAIITAHKRNEFGPASGVAYVFKYSQRDHKWNQDQILIPNDGRRFAEFGVKADLQGDTAVIGAWKDDEDGHGAGAAYVFQRLGGFWAQTAKLLPQDPFVDNNFGRSVAIYNGVVLVGALENAHRSDSGAVYIFTGHGQNWRQVKKLTSPNLGVNEDQFGKSIALDCPYTAIIGARYNSDQGYRSGNAYVVNMC